MDVHVLIYRYGVAAAREKVGVCLKILEGGVFVFMCACTCTHRPAARPPAACPELQKLCLNAHDHELKVGAFDRARSARRKIFEFYFAE